MARPTVPTVSSKVDHMDVDVLNPNATWMWKQTPLPNFNFSLGYLYVNLLQISQNSAYTVFSRFLLTINFCSSNALKIPLSSKNCPWLVGTVILELPHLGMGILCAYPPSSELRKDLLAPILLIFYYPLTFERFREPQSLVESQREKLAVGKLKSMNRTTLSVREATNCSLSLNHLICDINKIPPVQCPQKPAGSAMRWFSTVPSIRWALIKEVISRTPDKSFPMMLRQT